MSDLAEAIEGVDRTMRTSPPYTLEAHAKVVLHRGHGDEFSRALAAKYRRMARARRWLWAEYERQCLELDE